MLEATSLAEHRSLIQSYLLVWDLQQLQDHGVRPHVPQQPLLLLPALPAREAFLDAELAEPQQDLGKKGDQFRCNSFSLETMCVSNVMNKISTSFTTL